MIKGYMNQYTKTFIADSVTDTHLIQWNLIFFKKKFKSYVTHTHFRDRTHI